MLDHVTFDTNTRSHAPMNDRASCVNTPLARRFAEPHRKALGGRLANLNQEVSRRIAEEAPLKLTFGVEIEFVLLGEIPPGPKLHSFPAQMLVFHALTDEPVQVTCASCGEVHPFKLPVLSPAKMRRGGFAGWEVTTDISVGLFDDELEVLGVSFAEKGECVPWGFYWGMELNSRVFTKGENLSTTPSSTCPDHVHTIDVNQEITLVLQRLHDSFNTVEGAEGLRSGVRLAVNGSCGLHVHVGNGLRGFPLRTVKNLFQIYTANERSIDSIQSNDRITGSTYATLPLMEGPTQPNRRIPGPCAYNRPSSEFFITNAFCSLHYKYIASQHELRMEIYQYPFEAFKHNPVVEKAAHSFLLSDWLTLIENAEDVNDLRNLSNGQEHHNTVNLQNLFDFEPNGFRGGNKMTVEFRQHTGTIEAAQILAWIDLTTRIVEFAHNAGPANVRKHLDKVLEDPTYNVIDLVNELGCQDSTIEHYKHVLGRSAPGGSYASIKQSQQHRAVDQIPAEQDITNALRHSIVDWEAHAASPSRVQERVRNKLLFGGYGRWPRAYLDAVEPPLTKAQKDRLEDGAVVSLFGGNRDEHSDGHGYEDGGLDRGDPSDLALTPPPPPSPVQLEVLHPTVYGQEEQGTEQAVEFPRRPGNDILPFQPHCPMLRPAVPASPLSDDDLEMLPSSLLAVPAFALCPPRPSLKTRRRRILADIDVAATGHIAERIRQARHAVGGGGR